METSDILKLCEKSLIGYSIAEFHGYMPAEHHRQIAAKLEAVERGEIDRLMIFMPPRHGKSMLASEFFPAWYLGRNPGRQVIHATYAQDLADDFGRKVRNLLKSEIHRAVFPGCVRLEVSHPRGWRLSRGRRWRRIDWSRRSLAVDRRPD